MKKPPIFIFFDDIQREYQSCYGDFWEDKLVEDLNNYIKEFLKTSNVNLITLQDKFKIKTWFLKNKLYDFIDNISNPLIR